MTSVNTTQYVTLTWNIGGETDYVGLCRRAGIQPWDSLSELPKIRRQLFTNVFKDIFSRQKPDLIFLQEVGRVKPLISSLLAGYQLHFDGDDTMVAWKDDRFTEIEGSRQSQQLCHRYSIVDLKDLTTKKIIRISSSHIHGFDLNDPDYQRGSYKMTESGDEELAAITRLMLNMKKVSPDIIILGMDANSTPFIHPERLEILEKEGFSRDNADDLETAFNPTLPSKKAKIDFIYAKSLEGNCQVCATNDTPIVEIESPETNPSDHRPLFKTVKIKN